MSGSTRVCRPPVTAGGVCAEGGAGTVYRAAVCGPMQSETPVLVLPSQIQGTAMADDWPLTSLLELGALPSAAPCARLHAKQVLWEWGLDQLTAAVELVVSELITNAIHASQALPWVPVVRLWLLSDKRRVLIAVWDGNPKPPTRMDIDVETEGGRDCCWSSPSAIGGTGSGRKEWTERSCGAKYRWKRRPEPHIRIRGDRDTEPDGNAGASDRGPEARFRALENRAFLQRAVRYAARDGVSQFIDIGSGFPAAGPVHEVAGEIVPGPHVVYVDYDPAVAALSREIVKSPDTITVVHDLRHPWEIIATFRDHMVPGSYLILSHASPGENPDAADEASRAWRAGSAAAKPAKRQ